MKSDAFKTATRYSRGGLPLLPMRVRKWPAGHFTFFLGDISTTRRARVTGGWDIGLPNSKYLLRVAHRKSRTNNRSGRNTTITKAVNSSINTTVVSVSYHNFC